MKDANGVDMSRGFVRVTGLARVTLAVALLAVATNIRALEAFALKFGDGAAPGHILLQPRDTFVVKHFTLEEVTELEQWRKAKAKVRSDAESEAHPRRLKAA